MALTKITTVVYSRRRSLLMEWNRNACLLKRVRMSIRCEQCAYIKVRHALSETAVVGLHCSRR